MTQGLSKTSAILATLGVALALLLAALDQTVVGVAMPRIVSELHGLEYYAWVTTAYLITSTAGAGGRQARRYVRSKAVLARGDDRFHRRVGAVRHVLQHGVFGGVPRP